MEGRHQGLLGPVALGAPRRGEHDLVGQRAERVVAVAQVLLLRALGAGGGLEGAKLLDHLLTQTRHVLDARRGAQGAGEGDQGRGGGDQRVGADRLQPVQRQFGRREGVGSGGGRSGRMGRRDLGAVALVGLERRGGGRGRARAAGGRRADHRAVGLAVEVEGIAAHRTRPRIAHISTARSGTSPETCTATPPDCSISAQSSALVLISK